MSDKKTCREEMMVGYRLRRCAKPAKWICKIPGIASLMGTGEAKGHRCGIHAKRYEKIEEIKNG
jgi:hypothetical protein